MYAIVMTEIGGPEVLRIREREVPKIKPEEVLISVRASGINKPDIFQRKGNYPAPKNVSADILGLELSGVIEQCGEKVGRWKPGDEVCALVGGGAYATHVVANEMHCLRKPKNLSFAEAASLPETIFTVWHNVFQRGKLKPGENILIHGGSGGIGTTAIQLSAHFGNEVYITAGSKDKCNRCLELGASLAIDYKEEDFEDRLQKKDVHLILDSIGGDYFKKNMNVLCTDGKLIMINSMKGANVSLDLGLVMHKRMTISGSTLRNRSAEFKAALAQDVELHVWPLIESSKFKPVIDRTFSYHDVIEAHRYFEKGSHFGKVILTW